MLDFENLRRMPSTLYGVRNLTAGVNVTAAGSGADFLPGILESFIPGYSMIRRLALELFGFDVSVFVPVIGLLLALHAGLLYVLSYARDSLERYCTCAVDMNEWDEPYEAIMKWLNEKKHFRKARYLRVAGKWWDRITSRPEDAIAMLEREEQEQSARKEKLGVSASRTVIFNTEAKKPTGFEPDEGKYYFWYHGRPFCLNLYFKEMKHRETNFQKVSLSCFGFSTLPLKALIKEAMAMETQEDHTTDFWRPYPEDSEWKRVNTRPSRPLDTVTLDTAQKTRIVHDINDFIYPARKRWYASRGIPYRRGYLFSGPPGTGKTSMSLALAGVFGLGLFAVSIQDPTMSDTRLTELFDDLPSQCIILLEDIDSAGVGRSRTSDVEDEADESAEFDKGSGQRPKNQSKQSKVTLAGLLNAIDGVASHEGHILIMTTNHPEKLDGALKRPGRIDLHIEFTMATKFQAREIFLRMFTDEKPQVRIESQKHLTTTSQSFSSTSPSSNQEQSFSSASLTRRPTTVEEACRDRSQLTEFQTCPFMPFLELRRLADSFADALPDVIFSPAEIQGYLLLHKSNPWEAASGIHAWSEGMLKSKNERESSVIAIALSEQEEQRKKQSGEETQKSHSVVKSMDPAVEDLTKEGMKSLEKKKVQKQIRARRRQLQRTVKEEYGAVTPVSSDTEKIEEGNENDSGSTFNVAQSL